MLKTISNYLLLLAKLPEEELSTFLLCLADELDSDEGARLLCLLASRPEGLSLLTPIELVFNGATIWISDRYAADSSHRVFNTFGPAHIPCELASKLNREVFGGMRSYRYQSKEAAWADLLEVLNRWPG